MTGSAPDWIGVFDLSTRHTLAVIRAAPDARWDEAPAPGLKTLREQLIHLALVRESICRQLAGEATTGIAAFFSTEAWRREAMELAAAFEIHAVRCRAFLARLDAGSMDTPFTTPFGNHSTPRNYLRVLLLEEQHHRAQMTMALRCFGAEPPDYPGQDWVELGVTQEKA